MPERSKQLAASTWNPLYKEALGLYEDQYRERVRDIFQDGYFIGQVPFRDHEAEFAKIVERAPSLLAVAAMEVTPENKDWLPFRQRRVQIELQRGQELEQELSRAEQSA